MVNAVLGHCDLPELVVPTGRRSIADEDEEEENDDDDDVSSDSTREGR